VFANGIQDYYNTQVQIQTEVAKQIWGIEKAYFASYYPDGTYIPDYVEFKEHWKTLCVIDIDYDPKYCQAMIDFVQGFWKFIEKDYWDNKEYKALVKEFKEKTTHE
jgi:hypothetical protein